MGPPLSIGGDDHPHHECGAVRLVSACAAPVWVVRGGGAGEGQRINLIVLGWLVAAVVRVVQGLGDGGGMLTRPRSWQSDDHRHEPRLPSAVSFHVDRLWRDVHVVDE